MYDRTTTLVLALALAACGSDHDAAAPDAATPQIDAPLPAADAAIPADAPLTAAFPSQPMAGSSGGPVLAAPHIVPVFFANDATTQAQVAMFHAQLAGSSYWSAIATEYGVGAITVDTAVIATETPPTTDKAVQALVTAHAGGTGGWPANTPNTIYSIFLPDGVTLTEQGATSCVAFDGYHSETQAGVVYALLPRCSSSTFTTMQILTIAASHEYLEAATDPHPFSHPAFNAVDDGHAIWGVVPGAELGDMCEATRAAFQPLLGTFMVQRTWSNVSAAAGHDPCVPVLATPFVAAATNLPNVTIQGTTTPGISIPMGTSKTVDVVLRSDAPAPDWTVAAVDAFEKFQMQTPELSFAFDKTTGHDGDHLQLTITRIAPAQQGFSELELQSQVDGVTENVWFALVTE